MRTGAEYVESLHDGRKVWVMGEGRVDDVTTHPATCAMVQQYAIWYDRHFDPVWQDVLLTSPDAGGERIPLAFFSRVAKSAGVGSPQAARDMMLDHGESADAESVADDESPVPAAALARH